MATEHYTYSGNEAAESSVRKTLGVISNEITHQISQSDLKALILLGGYGKGEGGIVVSRGEFKPHNNFDLLLLTPNKSKNEFYRLNTLITRKVEQLEKDLSIGIDISVMPESSFKKMPTRVFSYDIKEGHRTLVGDETIIPSITRHVEDIPSWDVRNLMVNRGTLLLINQLCLDLIDSPMDKDNQIKDLIIKHTMKAIIGYGDALLFFDDNYHWSYSEKKKRLLNHDLFGLKFVRLYQDAMNFRFSPNYEDYYHYDLPSWQQNILETLERVHLYCERKRLKHTNLNWDEYLEVALETLPSERGISTANLTKSTLNLFNQHPATLPSAYSLLSKIGYHTSNKCNLIPIFFPLIAFMDSARCQRNDAKHFIVNHYRSEHYNKREIIKKYLKDWGSEFDHNLWSVLKKYNIDL